MRDIDGIKCGQNRFLSFKVNLPIENHIYYPIRSN